MSVDDKDTQEGFLSRWSRRKTEAREAPAVPPPLPAATDEDPPPLPPIEELTLDSDFKGFFHPKVDEATRRAALRKLFSEPHFNVMDGLDVYIDDYSKSEPIPAAMLAGLKQAQRILEWAKEGERSTAERRENEAPGSPDGAGLITSAPVADPEVSPHIAQPATQVEPLDAPEAKGSA